MERRKFIKLAGAAAATSVLPWSLLAQEQKQWAGYNSSIVIDGLSTVFGRQSDTLTNAQLTEIKNSGITAVNATIPYPGDGFDKTLAQINRAKHIIKKHSDIFSLITQVDDLARAKAQQKLGVIMGFQSTEMFADDLSRIEFFKNAGVRYMQMTYNAESQFGDGGLVKANRGLTSLGKEALLEMQQQKVLVDLSHSSQKTVADAIAISKAPITISHTGCNTLYPHPRNNDDKDLKAVADKGGVVGIYLMPFLRGGEDEITAEDVMRHLDHAINVCGEDHVSIGSDQGVLPVNDGPEYREMIRKEVARRIAAGISAPGETPNRPPFVPQLNSARRMELIAYYMKKRGYNDNTIEKIMGKNLVNLYKEVW